MKHWYLLLGALSWAAASTSTVSTPLNKKSCIDSCRCKLNTLPSRLQVLECDGPLTLNSTTFRYFNKQKINAVSFENVIIDIIEESAFEDFEVLEDVLILDSKIGSIDDKAFNNVKRLKFAGCGFEDNPDLFSEKLEELHFGSCNIEDIPKLNGLLSLTFLNLSGNYIKNIEIQTFAELYELEELHLSDNEIFKLPPTLFINNEELDSLYLDRNPLKEFYLNTSVSLETLSLKDCQLEIFDERSTEKLSTLSELNLSGNKITRLPSKTFANMKDLSVINLSNNRLEQLDDDIFSENPNLVKITLDGNNLYTLPNFYLRNGDVFTTYTFSCNNCGLRTLSSTVFKQMRGMIDLQLSHNYFMTIDNMFSEIGSLKMLDVSYNVIAYISPLTFSNNRNLENINIAGNPLMSLNPEIFANTRVLKQIDARNTSLQKLWSNYNMPIQSLQKLLVGDNLLTTLTTQDFKIVPNLKAIDLNNNPLVFSEQLCNVVNWLDHTDVSPIEYSKDLDANIDLPFYDSVDGFSFISWKEFYNAECPDIASNFVTTEESWPESDIIEESDSDSDSDESADEYDGDDDYTYDEGGAENDAPLSKYPQGHNNNLARASYILSITSVFILTALVVLTLAVTITLAILRRNNNFNMHRANLPRVKIPLWYSTPGLKKHSGSVYRPLSEDLSGPTTPKLSRYEFASTPIVHSSNP